MNMKSFDEAYMEIIMGEVKFGQFAEKKERHIALKVFGGLVLVGLTLFAVKSFLKARNDDTPTRPSWGGIIESEEIDFINS